MMQDMDVRERGFMGHPKALFMLFFTEMWERFSYYGMRSLLIFYLTQHFLFADGPATAIYGSYTTLIYMSSIYGGLIADRWLGLRKSIFIGGLLIICGHVGLAIEGPRAALPPVGDLMSDGHAQIFFLSLALLITGTGFFKPNISTVVGRLYGVNDPRRDAGFGIFYLGINIGGFLAPLLCGWLGQTYGWRYGFGLAAVGMTLGQWVFWRGQHLLEGLAEPPDPAALRRSVAAGLSALAVIYLSVPVLLAASWLLVQHNGQVGAMLWVAFALSAAWVVNHAVRRMEPVARGRTFAILIYMLFATAFLTLFNQDGSSLNLFAARHVRMAAGGAEFQPAQLQFLNPGFILLFTPLFAWGWVALGRRGAEPSTPLKFAIGMALIGVGFLALRASAASADAAGQVALAWLVLYYALATLAELCIMPVGLSMVTKLAAPHLASLMMAMLLLGYSGGSFLAARAAGSFTAPAGPDGLAAYADYFGKLGLAGLAVAALLLALTPALKRLAGGVR